jgi:hypothetical protein
MILPIEQLLKGLASQPSAFNAANFEVEAFVMPLYVPSDHIRFQFGGQLGALSGHQPRWWTISKENEASVMQEVLDLTRTEALPFLNRFSTPRDLAEYIVRDGDPDSRRTDPNLAEVEAYSWILAGEHQWALEAFQRLANIASNYKGPSLWVQEVAQRGERVKHLLTTAPSEALRQLAEWREYTLTALKLHE